MEGKERGMLTDTSRALYVRKWVNTEPSFAPYMASWPSLSLSIFFYFSVVAAWKGARERFRTFFILNITKEKT
jgi:hypothetical protein